ncbi:MAG: DUF6326 family protein [Candidatus Thorarchaeota archaeon]
MVEVKIILAFLWVATMLCYLLGDVVRIFAGDFKSGEMDGKPVTQKAWISAAIVMVIPIIMVFLSLIMEFPINGWVNVILASFFIIFNLAGIKGYKAYDIFLLIVSFVFNGLTISYALTQLLS